MGMIWSSTGRTDDPDPITGFTSRDIYLVQTTWKNFQKNTLEIGMQIFISLFTKRPDYQKLFPFRDMPVDELRQNKRFQSHCYSVMYGLSAIIDNIQDGELLMELLLKQGSAHRPRGVEKEAYGVLQNVLEEIVEKTVTAEEFNAWKKVLGVAFPIIVKGGNY